MKKILSIFFLIILIFSLTSCEGESIIREDKYIHKNSEIINMSMEGKIPPKLNITYNENNNSLDWNGIDGISYYTIRIGNNTYETYLSNYKIKNNLVEGTYVVSVTPNGYKSTTTLFTVGFDPQYTTIIKERTIINEFCPDALTITLSILLTLSIATTIILAMLYFKKTKNTTKNYTKQDITEKDNKNQNKSTETTNITKNDDDVEFENEFHTENNRKKEKSLLADFKEIKFEKTKTQSEGTKETNQNKNTAEPEKQTNNKCEICGQPTESNVFCKNCLDKFNKNEINKCAYCGKYFPVGTKCKCILDKETKNEIPNNINVNVTNEAEEKNEPGCFTKGCTGTLGVGCGAIIFITLIIGIIIFVIYTIGNQIL